MAKIRNLTQAEIDDMMGVTMDDPALVEKEFELEIENSERAMDLNDCQTRIITVHNKPEVILRKHNKSVGYLIVDGHYVKTPLKCIQYYSHYIIDKISSIWLVSFLLRYPASVGVYKHPPYQNISIDCRLDSTD